MQSILSLFAAITFGKKSEKDHALILQETWKA